MTDRVRDWFEPARLFHGGYPSGITSALRALPTVRRTVEEEVARAGGGRILEIGPGDQPVAPGALFLDVSGYFLRRLPAGRGVRGDVLALPFAPGAFDLVVASDVLTHIRPARRTDALAEMAALAPRLLLFNPEPGTADVPDAASPTRPLLDWLESAGFTIHARKFVTVVPAGEYTMRLVRAERRPPAP